MFAKPRTPPQFIPEPEPQASGAVALRNPYVRAGGATGLCLTAVIGLIAVGGDPARALADAAVAAGLPRQAVTWSANSDAAAADIVAWLGKGDLVLVKGSRGIKTDVVVNRIVEEFS